MTGCGKNKKTERVEDPTITALGSHMGRLCLHCQAHSHSESGRVGECRELVLGLIILLC